MDTNYEYSTSVIGSDRFPRCALTFMVHPVIPDDSGFITVVIETGAARLQTYATRDELRELGEMLLRHANANEVLEVA